MDCSCHGGDDEISAGIGECSGASYLRDAGMMPILGITWG